MSRKTKSASPSDATRKLDHISVLPFVKDVREPTGKSRRDFWSVPETGDWNVDFALGERLAEMALTRMVHSDSTGVLAEIVRDMAAKGRHGGVEVGYLKEICRYAMSACRGRPA